MINVAIRKKDGTRAKRDRRVDAAVVDGGVFAVHPCLSTGWDGEPLPCWTVTHVASGYAAILCVSSEDAARRAAAALARVPIDWTHPPIDKGVFATLPPAVQTRITRIVARARATGGRV